jgi:hypothetical protein
MPPMRTVHRRRNDPVRAGLMSTPAEIRNRCDDGSPPGLLVLKLTLNWVRRRRHQHLMIKLKPGHAPGGW